jgi:hypothetical protein
MSLRYLLGFVLLAASALGCTDDLNFADDSPLGGDKNGDGGHKNAAGGKGSGASGGSGALPSGGRTSDGGSDGTENTGGTASGQSGGNPNAGGTSGTGGSGAGGTTGGTGGNTELTAPEFCDQFADVLLEWCERCRSDCSGWPPITEGPVECEDAIASVDGGYMTFDATSAATCLEASKVSECSTPPLRGSGLIAPCQSVFVGGVSNGDNCSVGALNFFDECKKGYCLRDTGECFGSCAPFRTEGQSCNSNTERCDPALYCVSGKCEPLGGEGDDCSSVPCQSDLACGLTTETCQPLVPLGGDCSDARCEPSLGCAYGLNNTCRSPGPAGSDCVDSGDCDYESACLLGKCKSGGVEGDVCNAFSCAEGFFCEQVTSGSEARCTARYAPGADCDPNATDPCQVGYQCADGTCKDQYGDLNEPCGTVGCVDELVSLWCDYDADICRALLGEGGDCSTATYACQPDLFCMSDRKCHAVADEGQPCNPYDPDSCKTGLFCDRITGACQLPKSQGEYCNPLAQDRTCTAGLYCYCDEAGCSSSTADHDPVNVCTNQKQDGATCDDAFECLHDYCVGPTTPYHCASEVPPPVDCTR